MVLNMCILNIAKFQEKYKKIAEATGISAYNSQKKVDWDTVIKEYDYVLLSQRQLLKDVPQTLLTKVFQRKYTILYKVNPLKERQI